MPLRQNIVLFGREVTVREVFADAMAKLSQRVATKIPLKSLYSLQNRITIANIFLQPTPSFIQNYFVMSEEDTAEAERLSPPGWCLYRFRFNHLTAQTRKAGLSQPLKDLYIFCSPS